MLPYTCRTLGYHRAFELDFQDLPTLFEPNPGLTTKLFIRFAVRNVKGTLRTQGVGRHSPDEVQQIVAKDLKAVSTILGSKKYFLTDTHVTAFDAAVFSQLAVGYYMAPLSHHCKLMKGELSNLGEYVERMRAEFFPDWDELSVR